MALSITDRLLFIAVLDLCHYRKFAGGFEGNYGNAYSDLKSSILLLDKTTPIGNRYRAWEAFGVQKNDEERYRNQWKQQEEEAKQQDLNALAQYEMYKQQYPNGYPSGDRQQPPIPNQSLLSFQSSDYGKTKGDLYLSSDGANIKKFYAEREQLRQVLVKDGVL